MKLPVLILTFNRKDVLENLIDVLRQYRPERVYISSDGARSYIDGEREKVRHVRDYLVKKIEWECEIKTLFRDQNLGCKAAVHTAIQWFFSQENCGVVIEDDVLPSLNFFKFCEEALLFYQDDKKISSIGGRNELSHFKTSSDVVFSSKFFCWGWASWADRVLGLDIDISSDKEVKRKILKNLERIERSHVAGTYGLIESKQVNSWAYQYDMNFRSKGQLQVLPVKNMVFNSGLSIAGAHSTGEGGDTVEVFSDFYPKLIKETNKSDDFIHAYLIYRYRSLTRLFLFSKIKYLKRARKILKAVR